jgi:hypothetical protein
MPGITGFSLELVSSIPTPQSTYVLVAAAGRIRFHFSCFHVFCFRSYYSREEVSKRNSYDQCDLRASAHNNFLTMPGSSPQHSTSIGLSYVTDTRNCVSVNMAIRRSLRRTTLSRSVENPLLVRKFAVGAGVFSTICLVVARNQEVEVEAQLTLGVRMLQAQSHMCVLVHGSRFGG